MRLGFPYSVIEHVVAEAARDFNVFRCVVFRTCTWCENADSSRRGSSCFFWRGRLRARREFDSSEPVPRVDRGFLGTHIA